MGVIGFVLSVVSLMFGWIPFVRVPMWILAVVFSAIGLNKKPRGLAVAGLVVAVVVPALVVIVVVALMGVAAMVELLNIS